MRTRLALLSAFALGVSALGIGPAQASIIVSMQSGSPTAVAGGFDYTYGATLSADEQLDPTVQPVFFTLYDFGAATLISRTGLLATNFSFALNTNQATAANGTVPSNNGLIADVRASYAGPVVLGSTFSGNTLNDLGTFTLFTTFTGPFAIVDNGQDAQLEKLSPGSPTNDSPASNLSAIAIPTVGQTPPPVPEPATMALLGAGLIGLGALRRKRA